MTTETTTPAKEVDIEELERVTIRFAGDSGDGMQLTGSQFTRTAAVFGNDVSTLPDFPPRYGRLPGHCRASAASRSASRRPISTHPATSPTCWLR